MRQHPLSMRRSLAAGALATLLCAAAPLAGSANETLDAQAVAWAGEGANRAYIVIDYDDSTTESAEFLFAVRFTSASITGLQALQILQSETPLRFTDVAGYPDEIAFPYVGARYVGHNAWPDKWWSYWHSDDLGETWEMGLDIPPDRILRDGAMDGWINTRDLDWPPTMYPNGPRMPPDADNDGLADALETIDIALLGDSDSNWTHRYLPDSDADGLLDGQEALFGRETTTATLALTHPRRRDSDGDGFSDGMEVLILDTDPLDPDDPQPDDPRFFDTNNDGVPDDLKEALGLALDNHDSDGDGYADSYEIVMGTDPADSESCPSLGDLDGRDGANNMDAVLLMRHILGYDLQRLYHRNADVTADGMINNLDVVALFQWSLGAGACLPLCP